MVGGDKHLKSMLEQAAVEIARLREERKPLAWCVQAAAGSMVAAWTQTPIDAAVLIQCKDEADARMMAVVYGNKILWVVEPDEKELPRD
jgi:hypothetical protein